jgi:ketosteroid isomerase-like protein
MGTFELTLHDPTGKPVVDHGKYVTVWKKQSGGWKAVADIVNSDLPAPAPAAQ